MRFKKFASDGVCLYCGKATKNKQFCSGEHRKKFNETMNYKFSKRSVRGLRG
jgi:CDGSH-type Zn-finger protein